METEKKKAELDCIVTVNDGAYMTCNMIEDESSEDEKDQEDSDRWHKP
jgi:hypothetical protein